MKHKNIPNNQLFLVIVNPRHFCLGIVALLLGISVYCFDRNSNSVYFLFSLNINFLPTTPIFGSIGQHLPTFLHVFAFILLSTSVIIRKQNNFAMVAFFWFTLEVVCEFGQLLTKESLYTFPSWFAGIPFFENTARYFINGSFDWIDIISIAIGAYAAFIISNVL